MLNLNSPTVQAMLNNTPQGFGNIPVYYGNSPDVTGITQPVMPYPSPKEMLMNGGQAAVYGPTSFAPRNIVGANNPGYNAAFSGYYNPYMSNPYSYGMMYQPSYLDDEAMMMINAAAANKVTFDEEIRTESSLLKRISNIVSKNLDRSEDEAKKCEEAFEIYNKNENNQNGFYKSDEPLKTIVCRLTNGETVEASGTKFRGYSGEYSRNAMYVDQMIERNKQFHIINDSKNAQFYNSAIERNFDNMDLIDFFNNAGGLIMADTLLKEVYANNNKSTRKLYDAKLFRKQICENNGLRCREQLDALERHVSSFGIMPDGRPVSPGHDPSIADSFTYNPNTGQYTIQPPGFLSDRIERARSAFIRSVDNG